MWIKSIHLQKLKCFEDSGVIEFSKNINLLVGRNSAGKSTILRTIQALQPPPANQPLAEFFNDAARIDTVGISQTQIEVVEVAPNKAVFYNHVKTDTITLRLYGSPLSNSRHFRVEEAGPFQNLPDSIQIFHPNEPNNFIYPYFSNRKTRQFQLVINTANTQSVDETYQQLPSKIDRLLNVDSPYLASFRSACETILEFKISSVQHQAGKHAGLLLANGNLLPINSMGEGVLHVLSFLVHLCLAKGNLFLIEEIENDLHPKALKGLLDLMIAKSLENQFIMTTHSNIVVRHLGSVPTTKVFSVKMSLDEGTKVPTSTCRVVSNDPIDRVKLLEHLGYEPSDFYLWKAFLVLEESSAERVIRDFLIPYLVPKLQGKLKTIAAQGIADVEPRFVDFHRIFVFIHATPQYQQKSWVAVDNGNEGRNVIAKLKQKFSSWPDNHFRLFNSENFETYYPENFQTKTEQVLAMQNGLDKQAAKNALLHDVLDWATQDLDRAKIAFAKSANEIILFLQEIEKSIK